MKRAFFCLALLLAITFVVVLARRASAPEPLYDGKTISAWAMELNVATTRNGAEQFFRKADASIVPALVQMLQTRDPLLARPVKALGKRLPQRPSSGVFRMVDPFEAGRKRAAAAEALRNMGPRAEAAVPALRRALRDNETVSWQAALALAQMGSAGLTGLTNALRQCRPTQVPVICYAVGMQGAAASNAVPVLTKTLLHGAPQAAESAARALAAIGRTGYPTLEGALSNSNLYVRIAAAEALPALGPLARKARPKLLEMAESDEIPGKQAATNALARIGVW